MQPADLELCPRSATLAIVSREITVSALREWAATQGSQARGAVAVNWVGKWKTALQMAALTLLLILRMDVGEWDWRGGCTCEL